MNLTRALDDAFPEVDQPVRINLTGCFHACAQPQIADIGLTGGKRRLPDGRIAEVFAVQLGGHLGAGARFAVPLDGTVPENQLLPFCSALITAWQAHRTGDETFSAWLQGQPQEDLQRLTRAFLIV